MFVGMMISPPTSPKRRMDEQREQRHHCRSDKACLAPIGGVSLLTCLEQHVRPFDLLSRARLIRNCLIWADDGAKSACARARSLSQIAANDRGGKFQVSTKKQNVRTRILWWRIRLLNDGYGLNFHTRTSPRPGVTVLMQVHGKVDRVDQLLAWPEIK